MKLGSKRPLLVGALVVLLAPVVGCSDDGPKRGEAELVLGDDTTAVVERKGGDTDTVTSDTDLRAGDRVTIEEGDGVLRLPGGTTFEVRNGRGNQSDSVLVMGAVPVLEAGDLLVVTQGEVTVEVDDTDVLVRRGAARLGRGVGMRAGSYTAEVELDSAGERRDIAVLRQMQVATAGQPPATPSPFDYDPADPWDRRFLGAAIDLGNRLEALSTGFTQSLPRRSELTPGFFSTLVPGLAGEPQFVAGLLDPARPAGETLIGSAIALLGRRGTFEARWASVFGFRDAGAEWGLVALDQGVDGAALVAAVDGALDRAPLDTATTRPPTAPRPATPSTTAPGGGPSTPPTTVAPPAPPTTTTTVPPPEEDDDGGLLTPILGPLLSPVTDVLKALLGGLLG